MSYYVFPNFRLKLTIFRQAYGEVVDILKKSCGEISVRILKPSISCFRNVLGFSDLSSDADADAVLFDFGERLYGISLAFDSDSAGINARFLQCCRNACRPLF